jgi:glycolate oxidase
VVPADGAIIYTGSIMLKSAACYDLMHFIIGPECILGIVTKAA